MWKDLKLLWTDIKRDWRLSVQQYYICTRQEETMLKELKKDLKTKAIGCILKM